MCESQPCTCLSRGRCPTGFSHGERCQTLLHSPWPPVGEAPHWAHVCVGKGSQTLLPPSSQISHPSPSLPSSAVPWGNPDPETGVLPSPVTHLNLVCWSLWQPGMCL